MTNLSWHGEIRKRSSQDAHVNENLLDMAIYSAATISSTMQAIYHMFKKPEKYSATTVKRNIEPLNRARSMANELRHLAAFMESEKY